MSDYTHTVHCWNDKTKRKHFGTLQSAVKYANMLTKDGYKVKIYPYRAPKTTSSAYLDELEKRYQSGEINP